MQIDGFKTALERVADAVRGLPGDAAQLVLLLAMEALPSSAEPKREPRFRPDGEAVQAVVEAVRAGHTSPAAAGRHLGINAGTASLRMRQAAKAGLLERVSRGEYRAP
jgi:hypothetical protein